MSRRAGLSLMETVVATALLAICLLALFNLYPLSSLSVRSSQDRLLADGLAEQMLAEAQSAPWSTLVAGTQPQSDVTLEGTVFHRSLAVGYPQTDVTTLKGLKATVTWTWARGPQLVAHELYRVKIER